VTCFLEQVKNRNSPTKDRARLEKTELDKRILRIQTPVLEVLKKFHPVMVRMTAAAKDQGLELRFVPVYCNCRMPTDEAVGFWSKYWLGKAGTGGVTIAATVAGSQKAMEGLFPCLEHRFVLLAEESLSPNKTV
jgi:hypothetical protein